MKPMKSKKELLLSAGLILTATLGLTGCSSNTPTTPAPETNNGENVEVESVKPSTEGDATFTPESEVETQTPSTEAGSSSSTSETTKKTHPFGEIKLLTPFYDMDDKPVNPDEKYGRIEFNSTNFTKEDFLAFYEQEIKGSDYDNVEIILSDNLGIIFNGTKGVFGVNNLYFNHRTGTHNVLDCPSGFIQEDGEILYSEENFFDIVGENLAETINEKLSTYEITHTSTDPDSTLLSLYVDPSFLPNGTYEKRAELIREAVATIASEIKELPSFITIHDFQIFFYDLIEEGDMVAQLSFGPEVLMTTDWDAFARGELLSGDFTFIMPKLVTSDLEQFSQQLKQKNPNYNLVRGDIGIQFFDRTIATITVNTSGALSSASASERLHSVYEAIADISTEFLKFPNSDTVDAIYLTLVNGNSESSSIIAQGYIDFEELVETNWDTFSPENKQSIDLYFEDTYFSDGRG